MGLVAAIVEVRGDLINSAAVSFAGFSDRAYRLEAVDDLLKGKSRSDSLFLDAAEAAIALIEFLRTLMRPRDIGATSFDHSHVEPWPRLYPRYKQTLISANTE